MNTQGQRPGRNPTFLVLAGILFLFLIPLPQATAAPVPVDAPAQAGEQEEPAAAADQAGRVCRSCRYRNDADWTFCISCGQRLEAGEQEDDPESVSRMLRTAVQAVFRVRSAVLVPGPAGKGKGKPGADDRVRMSFGSAVLIDEEGTVVTSTRSLMKESQKAELISSEGESQVALIVARDPATELAVLRIQTGDLHPVPPCGKEEDLQVGDRAWFIGYPIATNPDEGTTSILPQSIKETMISGLEVGGLERLQLEGLISFDAELNTATGGGALLSSRGCLLGIGIEPRGTDVSIATPWHDTGRSTVQALKEGAAPERFFLGLGLAQVTDFEKRKYGLATTAGVLVDFVVPGSPAAAADIQDGDLLLEADGKPVQDPALLYRDIPVTGQGPMTLVVERGGARMAVSVVPARRPPQIKLDILDEVERWFGLGFRAVTHGGIGKTGLHVTAIRPGGLGERYLKIGDVVQKVNQTWVNDEVSFRQVAGDDPGEIWMRVRRPAKGLFSVVYRRGYQRFRQPQVY